MNISMTETEFNSFLNSHPNLKVNRKYSSAAKDPAIGTTSLETKQVTKRKQKYNAKPKMVNDIRFDSSLEADRYNDLLVLEAVGEISDLKRQVVFTLVPKQHDEKAVTYKADFKYLDKSGKTIVEDVKSPATKTTSYIIKRKLLKYQHPELIFREIMATG